MTRNPSCLISCSHWLPEGSLSVLVGRHGAMNPAGRLRCNIMPIARDYSRASQSFLFARLTRAEHDFIPPDDGVRLASGRVIMKTRYRVILSMIAGAALGGAAILSSTAAVAQQGGTAQEARAMLDRA